MTVRPNFTGASTEIGGNFREMVLAEEAARLSTASFVAELADHPDIQMLSGQLPSETPGVAARPDPGPAV